MTIYDFDKIDIIGNADNALKLIIVDPGNLVDDDRLYALQRKLRVYQSALEDPDFRSEHPSWENTHVQITVAEEPTEAMKEIRSFTFEVDGKEYKVPVSYEFTESPYNSPGGKMHLIDANYNYKTISDKVINLATDFIKMGSFTPFGMSWNADGKSKIVDVSFSEPQDQIPTVKQGIQNSISEDPSVQAVAVAYDVLAIHPDQTEKSDAIAIDLEHRLGEPLTMLVHYTQQGDTIETLKPYAMKKELELFSAADLEEDFDDDEELDLSGDDDGTSDAELQSWLESLPTVCFILVSGIDGKIDKKETAAFATAIQEHATHRNPLVREVFTAAAGRFEKDMTEIIEMGESGALLMPMRIALSRQTALKKAPDHAEEFFRVMIDMSTAIARASGGVFGFGNKISKEETAALTVIESMLLGSDSDK